MSKTALERSLSISDKPSAYKGNICAEYLMRSCHRKDPAGHRPEQGLKVMSEAKERDSFLWKYLSALLESVRDCPILSMSRRSCVRWDNPAGGSAQTMYARSAHRYGSMK